MTTPSTTAPRPDDLAPDTGGSHGPGTATWRPTVDGMLWLAFHRAVTRPSADLRTWLDRQQRTARATGRTSQLALGRAVADLLETPRCALTGQDIRVMRAVLHRIRELRGKLADAGCAEDAEALRWQLMALGHDPRRAER